jgi:MFS family permease
LIAWLSAAPALIAAIVSVPSARFLAKRRSRRVWLFGSLLVMRLGYGVVALIPLLFRVNTATWLVLWIVVLNVPAIFFGNGFSALLGELIPEGRRAFVFSRRSVIYNGGLVILSALAGAWLDTMPFPTNYQLMYAFGFIMVLGSNYYLHRLRFPEHGAQIADQRIVVRQEASVKMTPPMLRMLFDTAIYQFGLTLPGALFNVFYIGTLKVTDGWLGLNSAAAFAGVIVGYLAWERLLRRHTFSWVQRRATLLTWIFPMALAVAPDPSAIMVFNFAVNAVHSGVDLSNTNVLLKLTRPEQRTVYISWYNAVVNGSAFLGPLVGVWIAGLVGIVPVLLLSALLRIVGGILFNVNPVDVPAVEPVAVTS